MAFVHRRADGRNDARGDSGPSDAGGSWYEVIVRMTTVVDQRHRAIADRGVAVAPCAYRLRVPIVHELSAACRALSAPNDRVQLFRPW